MAQSGAAKRLIKIDISSDIVYPWCFVGKKNLDNAIALSREQFNFEVRWHPFFLDASAPKEGINKREFIKFGSCFEQIISRMTEFGTFTWWNYKNPFYKPLSACYVYVFRGLGLEYNMNGLMGNTLDNHRLNFAEKQGLDKQHNLVEELFIGYFTQAKFIGDRNFLIEATEKVGVEGDAQFLKNTANGVTEVNEDLEKYSAHITGVPYFVINGNQKLGRGQPA